MAKFVCLVCGYVHEDLTAPVNCPVCMSPASEFSEIKEVPPIENESTEVNIEEDVEEVIETEGDKTGESINESDKDRSEPNEFIKQTIDNANNQGSNSDSTVSVDDKMDADEEAIVKEYQERPAFLQVIKWYRDTYNVDFKEAKDRVEFVLEKHGLWSPRNSGNGCMVTILIAISSTLSLFFLL